MLTNRIEEIIIQNLFYNEEYLKQVFPFLSEELFFEKHEQLIFSKISLYVNQYHTNPALEAILIQCDGDKSLADTHYKQIVELLGKIKVNNKPDQNLDWLIEETEKFCKERSLTKAILEAHELSQDPKESTGRIPEILQKALSVSFNTDIGHEYTADAEKRYDAYSKVENKTACDLELVNKITDGGVSGGTLNMILAGCVHPDTIIKIRIRKKNG